MTTTDTLSVTAPDASPNRDEPEPTHIPGIADTGEGEYAVTFTLYLDAANPEEAEGRAMWMRQVFVDGATAQHFDWHLHDHNGC